MALGQQALSTGCLDLAWLEGWLAEQRAIPSKRGRSTRRARRSPTLPAPSIRPGWLAHGRLLRRTGQRRPAIDRLRRANDIYLALRAKPFLARTEQELAACHLPASPALPRTSQTAADRTGPDQPGDRVAHLVGKGMSNPEIASEQWRQPATV
jgi:hypothetical protein